MQSKHTRLLPGLEIQPSGFVSIIQFCGHFFKTVVFVVLYVLNNFCLLTRAATMFLVAQRQFEYRYLYNKLLTFFIDHLESCINVYCMQMFHI